MSKQAIYQKVKNDNISFAPAFADSNEPRKLSAIHNKKAPHLRCILHYIAGFAEVESPNPPRQITRFKENFSTLGAPARV